MKIENPTSFKIYIDFDGTITTKDIGEHMFLEFGDPEECKRIIENWLAGKLNSKEVWTQLCKTVSDFNEEKFDKFLESISIDPYFHKFIEYAHSKNFEVTILSDGLDYYINKVQTRENFDNLKLFCNKLVFSEDGDLVPQFPFTDEECEKCANCKRNHILDSSDDEDITIYIGDGWSDTCAAEHCDYIFAKRSLLKFCEQNGVPYYPFKTFADVQKIIEQLSSKKKVKKRHRALLKRKEAYCQG